MKKLITYCISMIIALSFIPTNVFSTNQSIQVFIDGVPVGFSSSSGFPFILNERTLVPLRAAMESFGATVNWEDDTKTAVVRKDTTTVRCKIGENCIYRNNVRITNDAAAIISDGRTYLPIRAVLEAFGATVDWDGSVKVTSPGDGALVFTVENAPSVTKNYWGIWNDAIALKNSGDYSNAISKIISISSVFISENSGASNAMLFKHLGECYSHLKDYSKASACFKREAYYWSITPGMNESRIDADRRSTLIESSTQLYIKNNDSNFSTKTFFGVSHEPEHGIYLGAYAEGDPNIYNPYIPEMFYMNTFPDLVGKDIDAYLLYLPYGTSLSFYSSHLQHAKEKDKIMQISLEPHNGLNSVNSNDGYLIQLAKDMQNSGCKMMLRFAGEMNDTTSTWFTTDTNAYIEKFRMVADIFHTYAPSVPIIWAPNHYPQDTIDDYYPGDKYVDYVGISSYKMHQPITDPLGADIDRSRWSNQLDTIYSLYGHKKPIIICESGASCMDYDTRADITPFASNQIKDFYTYLPIKYPNIKMSFIFDSDRDRQKFCLSNHPAYLSAFKEGIASDMYSDNVVYDYYELGNNVNINAQPTQLCSYITTPDNSTAYVVYSINGVDLGTSYSIPYAVNADFTGYKGQKVNITVRSFNSNHLPTTSYSVLVNVM